MSQRSVRPVIGVSIQPGTIALARMPWRASSTESAFIMEMSPPWEAARRRARRQRFC